MAPPTYFAILALAAPVLTSPGAGYHGHETQQRSHRRDAPAAYGKQCDVVTVTATEEVTGYNSFSASSTDVASITDSSTISSLSDSTAKSSSCRSPTNSTHPVPNAYSVSYYMPVPITNNSEAAALSATASAPAYTIPSSICEAVSVPTSASSAPAYFAPSSSAPSKAAQVSTSTSPAITTSISAIGYENKGLADNMATSSTSTTGFSTYTEPSKSSTVSFTGSKRGLAYNDASLTDCFTGGSEVTWAYNWDSSAGDLASGLNFIPTLWGSGPKFANSWIENAKSAISSGSTTLFSFNEPDLPAQANISPAAAAAAYKTYMNPLGDSAKLCAPSVSNSGTDGQGLSWLSKFLDACTDCQIDCVNIHWYDSSQNAIYFKSHIEDATTIANGKPIYVSEFGASGSAEEISSFLQEVMPYMDSNSAIAGYAYFMVSEGLLVNGTEPSTYGTVYKSYSS